MARVSGRLQSLQVLRFFAALGVTIEHALTILPGRPPQGGAFGVDVFFVLSGFVISHAAVNKPDSFLRNRLTRIFPGYWLWAVGWVALAALDGPLDARRLFTTWTLLPLPGGLPSDSYVFVGWTLSFELLFYTAVWLSLRGVAARWLLTAFGAACVGAYLIKWPTLHFLGSPMVLEFLAGVAAYRIGRVSKLAGSAALAAAALAWFLLPKALAVESFDPVLTPARAVALGGAAFLVVFGAAQFDCIGWAWRPLVVLGDASYSLYLSHMLLFLVVVRLTGRFDHPLLAASLAVLVGLAAYLLFERPFTLAARRAVGLSSTPIALTQRV